MNKQFTDYLSAELDGLRDAGLYKAERVIASKQSGEIAVLSGERVLNFCANNYLGLADNPELIETAQAALDRYGYGMASVRFICGTQEEHRQLEQRIAAFLGTGDAILYSSCFDANTGLFETILREEDAIISDALNHASIIDGVRLCKARRYRYANNDMAELERCLEEAADARFRLIATDGVFSMDGIIANLPGICALAEKHDAMVMVDDSHAVGFVGPGGRGTPAACGVADRVDIVTGTLGKALGGASGGYTAARCPGGRVAAPALAALPVLEHAGAGDRRDLAARVLDDRGRRRAARAALCQRPAVPRRHDGAGLHLGRRRPPDHPGHAGRRGAGRPDGRHDAGARRLRDRLLVPRRAQGAGAHPHADVGGALARGSCSLHRHLRRGRTRAGGHPVTTMLFYTEENGLVMVVPEVDPGEDEIGGTFWPVFHGGAFCGLTYDELRGAGKGSLAVDGNGTARIRK